MFLAYYLGFALFGALSFALGLRVARGGKWPAFAGYAFVLTLLLTKAVLIHNPPWEFALFGGWRDYIFLQSYLIFPLGRPELLTRRGFWPDQIAEPCIPSLASFVLDDPSGSPSNSLFDLDDLSSPSRPVLARKGTPCFEKRAVPLPAVHFRGIFSRCAHAS